MGARYRDALAGVKNSAKHFGVFEDFQAQFSGPGQFRIARGDGGADDDRFGVRWDVVGYVPDADLRSNRLKVMQEVTVDHVSQKGCVYGEYERLYQKDDQTYVMTFGEGEGSFQLWSWPKPMERYLPEGGGRCVVARGWIKTSGVRPIIILRTADTLESCGD